MNMTSSKSVFEHILIPTDLSDRARRPIELTTQLVGGHKARVTLLHVVEEIAQATRDEFQDFYQDLEHRSAAKLRELAGLFDSPGIQVARDIVYGNPAIEITTFAKDNDVDLIVLASHTIDPDQPRQGWGTLSHKVSVLAPCPVLLVK